ncbi:MAG: RagB/SusD family nutrient uptake outer membrane protein, partial [Prolixibacteraceae bacterium]|nr:RagB/SusD family nutrient uptake outer membrane protein [Prolixibacteraceae bacterium]
NVFEKANYSIGFNGGNTGTCPSQNLVDAYEMKDGTAFNWANPAQAADPYTNRDPRLAMTVVLNNSTFNGRKIELWEGGKDGLPINLASKTGYYLYKYVVQNLDLSKNQVSYHQWICFRLAEMYLSYAEAMNEAYGSDNNGGNTLTAREAVNLVRARTGVAMPAFPLGMATDQFRTRLRNERRVELAFEDHRYWDIRRWAIGSSALGGDIKGVKIAMVDATHFTYTPYLVESRTFKSQMDLYPIPQEEVVKSKGSVTQNPGW